MTSTKEKVLEAMAFVLLKCHFLPLKDVFIFFWWLFFWGWWEGGSERRRRESGYLAGRLAPGTLK